MHGYVRRLLSATLAGDLGQFPAVALLGPRQCGKTTLAQRMVHERGALYLDLERPSDRAKLQDAEGFLRRHRGRLVCLDEVQRVPGLFEVLRSLVDEDRRPGRFLLLGSASPALLRQSSESLAGRLSLLELSPFQWGEVVGRAGITSERLWLRGGFPESFGAESESASLRWREQFLRTFLEQDIPQLGVRVPATTLRRSWQMCAHLHGQVLNLSALGRSLDCSHVAARHYVDVLEQTYVLRQLPPLEANLGKRLVKSPRVYVRDSGLLHALLQLEDADALAGHPVYGASWEGFVVEQLLSALPGWRGSFFRTSNGTELDLVLERGGRRVAVECKASSSPTVTRGFWSALGDLGIREAYVVAPVREGFPLGKGVHVATVGEVLGALRERRRR